MKHEPYPSFQDVVGIQVIATGTPPNAPLTMPKQVIEHDSSNGLVHWLAQVLGINQIPLGS